MDTEPFLKALGMVPQLGAKLQGAGFFLIDFARGEGQPSQLMRECGYTEIGNSLAGFGGQRHPDDDAAFTSRWLGVIEGDQDMFHAEFRLLDRTTDTWRWVLSHGIVLQREDGRPELYVGVDLDISAAKASEANVRAQLREVETVFHQAESLRVAGLLANSTQDVGKTIDLVLGHAQDLLQSHAAVVSTYRDGSFSLLGSLGDTEEAAHPRPADHPLWSVAESRGPAVRDDLRRLRLTGRERKPRFRSWMGLPLIFRGELLGAVEFWHSDPRFFQSEQIWPAMGLADSIAESLHTSRVFETLRDDTRTDALTGLLTRRYLHDSGPSTVERCLGEGKPLALLFIDIDFFKDINDRHGHLVGDAVLMTIAQLCRTLLRREDQLFRYGGEEFVALLPETDAELAAKIAERLRTTAAEARFRGLEKKVTVSIGVVPIAPGHRVAFEQVLEEADQAMYRAKQGGRDQVMTSDRWLRQTDF